jgi:branched-chain amino acid aminotransferase
MSPAMGSAMAVSEIDLRPEHIEFGRIFAPLWYRASFRDGEWEAGQVEPLSEMRLHPAAVVLHYGQAIFEGMKAYKAADGSVNLFRPLENAKRFNQSALRMAMPELPESVFLEAVTALVEQQREWIPDEPGSLYIRPVMIATEPCIGVRGADEFLFYVITLPAGGYFRQSASSGGSLAVRVFVSESVGRAAHGGTGNVKVPGNYAVTLKVISEAKKLGCNQVLFLDSCGEGTIEEMGGMNVFFVRNGVLVTPKMTGTILPGVTRDSLLKLAPRLGLKVAEERLALQELLSDVKSGVVSEAMACGTAASVVGISSFLLEDGSEVSIGSGGPGPATQMLYQGLRDIQYGVLPDPLGWIQKV